MFVCFQLYWLTLWTGHMTGICLSALWLCLGWAVSTCRFIYLIERHFKQFLDFFYFCLSVCWQHFISRRSWSSRILPLQVREIDFFIPPPSFLSPMSAASLAPSLVFCGIHFCAFLGMNRVFGLSVLVYFQAHAFLCSGHLQIFPVYSFLWNLYHSYDYKIQHILQLLPFWDASIFIIEWELNNQLFTLGHINSKYYRSILSSPFLTCLESCI